MTTSQESAAVQQDGCAPSLIFSTPSFDSMVPLTHSRMHSQSPSIGHAATKKRSSVLFSDSRSISASLSPQDNMASMVEGLEELQLEEDISEGQANLPSIEADPTRLKEGNGEDGYLLSGDANGPVNEAGSNREVDEDSFNLAVLGREDTHNDSDVQISKPVRDHVSSDDAGPEDFTINLEKWMRGDDIYHKTDMSRGELRPNMNPGLQEHGAISDEEQAESSSSSSESSDDEANFEKVRRKLSTIASSPPVLDSGNSSHATLKKSITQDKSPLVHKERFTAEMARELVERNSVLQKEVLNGRIKDEAQKQYINDVEKQIDDLKRQNEQLKNDATDFREQHISSQDQANVMRSIRREIAAAQDSATTLQEGLQKIVRSIAGQVVSSQEDHARQRDLWRALHTYAEEIVRGSRSSTPASVPESHVKKIVNNIDGMKGTQDTQNVRNHSLSKSGVAHSSVQETAQQTREAPPTHDEEFEQLRCRVQSLEQQNQDLLLETGEREDAVIELKNHLLKSQEYGKRAKADADKLRETNTCLNRVIGELKSKHKARLCSLEQSIDQAIDKARSDHESLQASLIRKHADEIVALKQKHRQDLELKLNREDDDMSPAAVFGATHNKAKSEVAGGPRMELVADNASRRACQELARRMQILEDEIKALHNRKSTIDSPTLKQHQADHEDHTKAVQENALLKNMLAEVTTTKQALMHQIHDHEEQLSHCEQKATGLGQQVATAQRQLAEQAQEHQTVTERFEAKISELSDQLDFLGTDHEHVLERNKTLEAAFEQLQSDHEILIVELDRARSQLSRAGFRAASRDRAAANAVRPATMPSSFGVSESTPAATAKLEKDLAQAKREAGEARSLAEQAERETRMMVEFIQSRLPRTSSDGRDRDSDWAHRIDMLIQERDQMADALMHAWGREEVGPAKEGEKQAFRYRYVKGRF